MKNALQTLLVITLSSFYLLTSTIALGQGAGYPTQAAENDETSLPEGMVTIYSNLHSIMPTYDYTRGYYVAGPGSGVGEHFLAMPFTPKVDSHVKEIAVAMQWFGAGPNDVTIKLATGVPVPTTLVAGSTVTLSTLPTFTKLDCCPLPTVNYGGAGISLTGGTQYWVVAVTNSASTTTEDIWCLVWNDAIGTFAYNHGNGWKLEADREPAIAFAVLGTTP